MLRGTAKLSGACFDPFPNQEQRDSTVIPAAHISQSKSSLKWVEPGGGHNCNRPLASSPSLHCLPLHWLRAGNQIGGTKQGGTLLLAPKEVPLQAVCWYTPKRGFNWVTINNIRATSGESRRQTQGHCVIAGPNYLSTCFPVITHPAPTDCSYRKGFPPGPMTHWCGFDLDLESSDPSWEFSAAGSEFVVSWKPCSLITKSWSIPIKVFRGAVPMSLENCAEGYDVLCIFSA